MFDIAYGIIITCCAIGGGAAMIAGLGPGVGEGNAVAYACRAIAQRPTSRSAITTTMLMGCAISETCGLFALVVAILLIFVAPGILTETLQTSVQAIGQMLGAL